MGCKNIFRGAEHFLCDLNEEEIIATTLGHIKVFLFFLNCSYSVMLVPSLATGDLDCIFIGWYKY